MINYEKLRELLGFDTFDKVKTAHQKWVESYLENGDNFVKINGLAVSRSAANALSGI